MTRCDIYKNTPINGKTRQKISLPICYQPCLQTQFVYASRLFTYAKRMFSFNWQLTKVAVIV